MPVADIEMKCTRCDYVGTPSEFIHDSNLTYGKDRIIPKTRHGRLWKFFVQFHVTFKCPRCGTEQGLNWRDDA